MGSKVGGITLGDILGILVIAGIIVGIITPIVMYRHVRMEREKHWMHLWDFIKECRWLPFMEISKELEKEYSFEVSKGLSIVIAISGGGIRLADTHSDKVYVRVYRYLAKGPWKLRYEDRDYQVNYDENANMLSVDIEGYFIEVKVPLNVVSYLSINVNGGGAELTLSSSDIKELNADISGGALDLRIENLGLVNIILDVSGGALDGNLSFTEFTGESNITVSISGGAGDIDIKLPTDVKVKVQGGMVTGMATIKINHRNAGTSYIDEGFDQAKSKLCINYDVTGGVMDLGIHK